MSFLNYIIGLIAFIYAWKYAFSKKMVIENPWAKKVPYYCNQNLSFLLYCILTAMLFIGPISLVKYAVWIVIMLAMCGKARFRKPWNAVIGAYTLFVLWNIYTISYSAYPSQGWMMVLKFSLPYLYFWLGYNAITCENDFYVFLKKTSWICCIYALIIGGFSAKVLSPLYVFLNFTTGGLFISYASLADFFAILICAPITMYLVTKDRKYLYMASWMLLSTILESVRTGLGASVLAVSFFYMIVRKGKAVPYITLVLIAFVVSIFAIPPVREKMFGEEVSNVSVGSASMDNVVMNGREYIWESVMEQCYYGHELTGSGCGSALGWRKQMFAEGNVLIHSDWVQMRCESGNFGMGLFIFFAIVMLFKVLTVTWIYKSSPTVTYAGAITVAAFAACFFAMGFDNVITYAQQGYVIPFVFLGIFYKSVDLRL